MDTSLVTFFFCIFFFFLLLKAFCTLLRCGWSSFVAVISYFQQYKLIFQISLN